WHIGGSHDSPHLQSRDRVHRNRQRRGGRVLCPPRGAAEGDGQPEGQPRAGRGALLHPQQDRSMNQPPRRIDEVTPGHYRFRRVRGGPWLPAIVTLEDGMIYIVEADETLRVGISADSYAAVLTAMV